MPDIDQPALRYWPDTALPNHKARYGHHCYLREPLGAGPVSGTVLYRVEFDDGGTLPAFADELEIIR